MPTYSVIFRVTFEMDTEIEAEDLAGALSAAGKLTVRDLVDVEGAMLDEGVEVVGVVRAGASLSRMPSGSDPAPACPPKKQPARPRGKSSGEAAEVRGRHGKKQYTPPTGFPRKCKQCGHEFTATHGRNTICPGCKASKKGGASRPLD